MGQVGRTRKNQMETDTQKQMRPALTREARENQLISLAVDLAEKQLKEGTASSQVITHYLKLGSPKERLERERLEEENKLLKAKTEQLESQRERDKGYMEVLAAMKIYQGRDELEDGY